MVKTVRSALVAALALGLVLASAPARAEMQKWDQKQVAALANDLYASVKDLRDLARKSPNVTQPGSRRARYEALEDLRQIEYSCKSFAQDLAEGASQEETAPGFERIRMLARDASENARSAFVSEPVNERIAKAREILAKLVPYYQE